MRQDVTSVQIQPWPRGLVHHHTSGLPTSRKAENVPSNTSKSSNLNLFIYAYKLFTRGGHDQSVWFMIHQQVMTIRRWAHGGHFLLFLLAENEATKIVEAL